MTGDVVDGSLPGVDAVNGEMVQVGRTVDPVFVLESVPDGPSWVSAVNNRGESARSPVVSVQYSVFSIQKAVLPMF